MLSEVIQGKTAGQKNVLYRHVHVMLHSDQVISRRRETRQAVRGIESNDIGVQVTVTT